MGPLQVLADGGSGVPVRRVELIWEAGEVALSPEAMRYVEERWAAHAAEAESRGMSLRNGPITRLIEARRADDRIILRVGPGTYRDFVVTCLRDRAWFEAHAPDAITRALGNSALLTHGEQAILGIRSANVSAYAGRAHLIGGVLDQLGTDLLARNTHGLLTHLLMEIDEEAHVHRDELSPGEWPRLLGVVQDPFLGQPEAIWQWETRLGLEEIGARLDEAEHRGYLIVGRAQAARLPAILTPVAMHTARVWAANHP